MQYSLELPTMRVEHPDEFVTVDAISDITRAAAAAGFSAVFVTDHPAPDAKWLDHGGHHALDPFVALSFAAASDPDIKLHTNIYVAAYRNPFLGAKLIHSLDVLSGGRVLLGVAAGYLKPEFFALGVDFERRGALLDEALAVLDAVMTGDDTTWEGNGFNARGVRLRPTPRSGRRPPVWIGGNSKRAMRRAARFEGWSPFHTGGFASTTRTAAIETADDLREAIAFMRALVEEERGDVPFDVCWGEPQLGNAEVASDQRVSRVRALADAGVTWLTVGIPGSTRADVLAGIGAFGRDVIAEVASVT
jgi:probable F420-dependent oxidoreductase